MTTYNRKIRMRLTPEDFKIVFVEGVAEIELCVLKEDIFSQFYAFDAISHFDHDRILDLLGVDKVKQWLSEQE